MQTTNMKDNTYILSAKNILKGLFDSSEYLLNRDVSDVEELSDLIQNVMPCHASCVLLFHEKRLSQWVIKDT